ncbi:MAG: leucine-rich repeat protein [Clostridia bacterium]|nr:leucine-rich repeat protein [Clostridia bacterium]
MNRRLFNFCASMLLALLFLLPAAALAGDEYLAHDHVELFSEGYLPSPPAPVSARARSTSSFNSYIASQLEKQSSRIDVSAYNMNVETFKNAYWALLNSRPDLFYVSGGFSYYSSSGIVTGLLPNYKYTGTDLKNRIRAFNSGVAKVVAYANKANTAIGKLLLANDYLCVNFEYDTSYSIYSPDEMLSSGKGVCQAYMLLYRAVLNELGLQSNTATSEAMNHTWNVVYLNGSWYHIDVTWNDPLYDRPLGAFHDNFLRSDSGIRETGHHSWDFSTAASSTKYDDFFWTDISFALPVVDDVVYYLDPREQGEKRVIRSWDIGSGAGKAEYTFSARANNQVFYTSDGDPLWATDDTFYYGVQNKLYSVNRSSRLVRTEYDTGDSSRMIRRLFMNNGTLRMYIESWDGSGSSIVTLAQSSPKIFTLPAGTTAIKDEAFVGVACTDLVLPDGLVSIGERAFSGCAELVNVYLPASLTAIADDAFDGCSDQITFICPDGSAAQAYAQAHGFSFTVTE